MKKLIIGFVGLLSLLNTVAIAQTVKPVGQTLKPPVIVFIDMKEASDKSDFGRFELARFNAKLDVHKEAVAKRQNYINELSVKLQDPKNVTVTSAFYNNELRLAQRFTEDTNIEIANLNKQLTKIINDYISAAVVAYAEKNKIDVVLPIHLVYIAQTKYNATEHFLTFVNKEYKK